jgi:hypothetical protein
MKVMMAMVIVMKVILIVKDVMTRVAMMMRHAMEAVMREAETAAVVTDSYSIV